MRSFLVAAVVALLVVPVAGSASAQLAVREPVDYVDPMIGTLAGGFTFPGPASPFGMVQLSPDTEGEFAYTGYQYADTSIRGFSHHHIESMGVHSNGDLPFMPTVGPVRTEDPRSWMSPFDHASEEAQAGYYRVVLERYGILAELTAGRRVGMHRYTFPPSPQANVILDVGHNAQGWTAFTLSPTSVPHNVEPGEDNVVLGTADTKQGYDIHFAARFDRPFTFTKTGTGAVVTFDTFTDRDVLVKVGISFVSRQNALENLDSEKPDWDFEALRQKTREEWNDALKTITVSGGTDADKTSFYTALYHAQHHPNIAEDVNGQYMGVEDLVSMPPPDPNVAPEDRPRPPPAQVHVVEEGAHHYVNFSLWDTYRGLNQLLATIQPGRYRDMLMSLLHDYQQAQRFPQWAMNDAYPDYMEGDPIQPTVVDGYCRGVLEDGDVEPMYAALRAQAWDEKVNGVGKRSAAETGYQEYHQKGYMSGRGADASGNFEYAIADFALALMADSLGRTEDRDELLKRADNYKEMINPGSGFAHPRNADGTWMSGYDPMAPDYWKEGTGWQYTWLAPHDFRGLFDLVGSETNARAGDATVIERLDTFFSTQLSDNPAVAEVQKTITFFGVIYAGNQYAPSNEHDLQAPYAYDYIGQPWKTQKIMRGLQALYRPTPDGLPGNDDLGSMSAWFVWSALGFYPEVAGAPLYVTGSPMFERADIAPTGGKGFVVEAPGASMAAKYVQSAKLGDESLERPWFTHAQLLDEGSVRFEMGPFQDEEWGSLEPPPSMSTHGLGAFGCPRREVPDPIATVLTYEGETRAKGELVNVAAALMTTERAPLPGEPVTFEVGGQTVSAVTDASGIARAAVSIPDHGRSQTVVVRFAGTATLLPSETSAVVSWGASR